ncbi:MAG: response regulator [Desulfobacterales bacterium]|nr:response regulator [Desulfobacterales bacterium]
MANVLIAEDDITTLKLIEGVVGAMDHETYLSSDGKHAWETLCSVSDIKLLITDIKMPEIDGRQLIEMVRNRNGLKNLPIIVISGVLNINEVSDLLKLGATNFLAKPVSVPALQEVITNILGPEKYRFSDK